SDEEPIFSVLSRVVDGGWGLPLIDGSTAVPAGAALPPVWVSEAAADRHRLALGDRFELPIGARMEGFVVAGIWRDYARQYGAAVLGAHDYVRLTGDTRINDVAVRVAPGHERSAVAERVRALFGAEHVRIALPGEIRAATLEIFDRTFLITYLMEAVAVVIGLFGIATTFAALSTTRQGEFGMLRHLGLSRGEIG